MARLWMSGAELNSLTVGMEWSDVTNTSGELTIVASPVHSGAFALRCTGVVSGQVTGVEHVVISPAGDGPAWFRVYFRYATLPSADNTIMAFNNSAGFTSLLVSLQLKSDGTLELNDEDGVIGSPSAVLSADTWHCIELKVDKTPAAGSEVVEARLNGSVFATSSARAISAGMFNVLCGGNMAAEAQTTGDWFFDDWAVNDSTGSFQTAYPGLVSGMVHLRPNAAGDTDAWDAVTTFEDIDENPPDDATTIIASLTSGETHEVNIDATPAAIGAGDTIPVVQVGVRFTESVATDPDPTFVLRCKASAGGTTEEGSTITANSTAWRTHIGPNPRLPTLTLYDLPGASTSPWTKADLDTTQIGVRLTNSPVGLAHVTAMWLAVEYINVAAASLVPKRHSILGLIGR